MTKEESITLSDQSTVDKEIPAGIYDITPEAKVVCIGITSNEMESYAKEQKSYNLKDGYKLDVKGSASFTKVR